MPKWKTAVLVAVLIGLLGVIAGEVHTLQTVMNAEPGEVTDNGVLAQDTRVIADSAVYTKDGKKIPLSSFRGKWLLFNFWATWCGPCRMEMPDLDALYKREHPAGLDVLGVTVEDPGVVLIMLAQLPDSQAIHYPLAFDHNHTLYDALDGVAIPRTLIIDPHGKVVADLDGAQSESGLIHVLRKSGFPLR